MKKHLKFKTISLPKLDGLSPSLESTALKVAEEQGELARAIGKFRGISGEKVSMTQKEVLDEIAKELLDVAQTTISMCFVLEEEYGVDIDQKIEEHIQKLINKGYIKAPGK